MVLMILAISALDNLMPSMAAFIACMSLAPVSAAWRAWLANSLALSALSALRLVMLDISSSEELVSSSEAACSLAPSANDWLEPDTCAAAEVTWLAPSLMTLETPDNTLVIVLMLQKETAAPMSNPAIPAMRIKRTSEPTSVMMALPCCSASFEL